MQPSLSLEQALERYPLHPLTRALVLQRAQRRLLDNPEETPDEAVRAALLGSAVECAGCGLYVVPGRMVVVVCDVCEHPVCPGCVRMMGTIGAQGVAVVALCPRCLARFPRKHEDIVALRRALVREFNRPDGPSANGTYPVT